MPRTTSFTSHPTSHRATFYDEEGRAFDPGTCHPCDRELQELTIRQIQEVVASPWFRKAFEKQIFKPGERQTHVRVILESDRVTVIQGNKRIVAAAGPQQPDANREVYEFLDGTIKDVNQIYSNCLRNHGRAEQRNSQGRNSYNYHNSSRYNHFTGPNVRGREGSAFHTAEASYGSHGGRGGVNSYADSENSDSDDERAPASQHSRHLASQRARTRGHESTFEGTDALFRGYVDDSRLQDCEEDIRHLSPQDQTRRSHFFNAPSFVNDPVTAEDDDEFEGARSRTESDSFITSVSPSIRSLSPEGIQVREADNVLRPATHRRGGHDSASARELADLYRSNPLYEQINARKIAALEARLATLEALLAQSSTGSRPRIIRNIRAVERELEIRRSDSDSSSSTSPPPTSRDDDVSRRHSRASDADYYRGTSSTGTTGTRTLSASALAAASRSFRDQSLPLLPEWLTTLTSPSGNQANGREEPLQGNGAQPTTRGSLLHRNENLSDSSRSGTSSSSSSSSFELAPQRTSINSRDPAYPQRSSTSVEREGEPLNLTDSDEESIYVSESSRSGTSSSSSSSSFSLAQQRTSLNSLAPAAARRTENLINLNAEEQLRRQTLENGGSQELLETYFSVNTQSRASQKTFIEELKRQILSHEGTILEVFQEREELQKALRTAKEQLGNEQERAQQALGEIRTLRESQPSIQELQDQIHLQEETIRQATQARKELQDTLRTATENFNSQRALLQAGIAEAQEENQRALQEASNRHKTEIASLHTQSLPARQTEIYNNLIAEERLERANLEKLLLEATLQRTSSHAQKLKKLADQLSSDNLEANLQLGIATLQNQRLEELLSKVHTLHAQSGNSQNDLRRQLQAQLLSQEEKILAAIQKNLELDSELRAAKQQLISQTELLAEAQGETRRAVEDKNDLNRKVGDLRDKTIQQLRESAALIQKQQEDFDQLQQAYDQLTHRMQGAEPSQNATDSSNSSNLSASTTNVSNSAVRGSSGNSAELDDTNNIAASQQETHQDTVLIDDRLKQLINMKETIDQLGNTANRLFTEPAHRSNLLVKNNQQIPEILRLLRHFVQNVRPNTNSGLGAIPDPCHAQTKLKELQSSLTISLGSPARKRLDTEQNTAEKLWNPIPCLQNIYVHMGLFGPAVRTQDANAQHVTILNNKIAQLKMAENNESFPDALSKFLSSLQMQDIVPSLLIYAQERKLLHSIREKIKTASDEQGHLRSAAIRGLKNEKLHSVSDAELLIILQKSPSASRSSLISKLSRNINHLNSLNHLQPQLKTITEHSHGMISSLYQLLMSSQPVAAAAASTGPRNQQSISSQPAAAAAASAESRNQQAHTRQRFFQVSRRGATRPQPAEDAFGCPLQPESDYE